MTSKEYREKRELKDLNNKVNTNWQQISNMEALIAKKTALLASRQAPSHPPTALSSSHPPTAPLDTPDIAQADVHASPARSSSTVTLKSQVVHKK